MKVFLDTSSLFKLYHQEVDSGSVESIFTDFNLTEVFLSELSKIEFASTVWKKVRKQDIIELQAKATIDAFVDDYSKYTFVQIDNIIIEQAKRMITKYGRQGLRTLDSIQLSSAIMLKGQADLFLSSDKLLDAFFKLESLPTEKPSR